jgi:hypothetical protein
MTLEFTPNGPMRSDILSDNDEEQFDTSTHDKYGYPRTCCHCELRIKHNDYAIFRSVIEDGKWIKRSWHNHCWSGR